ncbi:MAG TPA: hypothetical protein VGS97_09035, partial [Actinocrinis sp.]
MTPTPVQPGTPHPQPSNTSGAGLAHTGAEIGEPAVVAGILIGGGTVLGFGTRYARRLTARRK